MKKPSRKPLSIPVRTPQVKRTVFPDAPAADFNEWAVYVRNQVDLASLPITKAA